MRSQISSVDNFWTRGLDFPGQGEVLDGIPIVDGTLTGPATPEIPVHFSNRWTGARVLDALAELEALGTGAAIEMDFASLCLLVNLQLIKLVDPENPDEIAEFQELYGCRLLVGPDTEGGIQGRIDSTEADAWLRKHLQRVLESNPDAMIAQTPFGEHLDNLLYQVLSADDAISALVIADTIRCMQRELVAHPHHAALKHIADTMTAGYRQIGASYFKVVMMALALKEYRKFEDIGRLTEDVLAVTPNIANSQVLRVSELAKSQVPDAGFIMQDWALRCLPWALITCPLPIFGVMLDLTVEGLILAGIITTGMSFRDLCVDWFKRPLQHLGAVYPKEEFRL